MNTKCDVHRDRFSKQRIETFFWFPLVRRIIVVLWLACSITGCSSKGFTSWDQNHKFSELLDQTSRLKVVDNDAKGVMIVFDTDQEVPTVKFLIRGETQKIAMRDLAYSVQHPCASDGQNARIVAFSPPKTVDLPISVERCSVVFDQVQREKAVEADISHINEILVNQAKINGEEQSAMRSLNIAIKNNSRDIDRLVNDVSRLSSVQQSSWDKVMAILAEMSKKMQAGSGG